MGLKLILHYSIFIFFSSMEMTDFCFFLIEIKIIKFDSYILEK